MRPYKTKPVIVERLWGGRRLSEYNKRIQGEFVGESWETGPLNESVPVLIKLIDAKETLSVQVHPDDEFALKVENEQNGKNEAWVVLECDEGACITYGFNRPVGKEELKGLLERGLISEVLNHVKVKKGDCVYIPAGTVHSLGKGILVYEVQQPSDLTYRIYDWGRTDTEGKRRELHTEKALEAINYSMRLPEISNIYDSSKGSFFNIINCRHFESSYRSLKHKECQNYEPCTFRAITTISGSTVLKYEDSLLLSYKGDTCIIPKEYEKPICIEGLEAAEYIMTSCNV